MAQTGIVPSSNAMGVRRLDSLILSHHDIDHDGGFQSMAAVGTNKLLVGQPEFYPSAEFCQEDKRQWDDVDFELLRSSENTGKEDNDQSCVLRVVVNDQALLITGGLGVKGKAGLIEKYGNALYSQVLVLGRHGSSTASSGSFLHTVSPQYAVAPSGYANAHKYPTITVQDRVRAHSITLSRTDLSGALVFVLGQGDVFRGHLKKDKFYWQKKPFE